MQSLVILGLSIGAGLVTFIVALKRFGSDCIP